MVDPAPYRGDTPGLLPFTLGQGVLAVAYSATLSTPLYLDVLPGSTVSFDALRTPYAQAVLVTRIPDDQTTLDALDPRRGVTVNLSAGYARPDGVDDLAPVANLRLRRRRVNRPADTMTLELTGAEAVVMDAAGPSQPYLPGGATLTALITNTLTYTLGVAPVIVENTVTDQPYGTAVQRIEPGQDFWDWIDNAADRMGGHVWHDALTGWHYAPRKTLTGTPDVELTVGLSGTVLDSDTGLSREGWANAVTIGYAWEGYETYTDGSGSFKSRLTTFRIDGTASVTAGPWATSTAGVTRYVETRNVPTTQDAANAAAAAMLAIKLRGGRTLSVSAIAAWWTRPDDTVRVTLPLGAAEDHLCSSVTFDLYAGRMTCALRQPDTVSTVSPGA